MNVQIGGLAAFLASIALFAKILDWYLTSEEKQGLRDHIAALLERGAISGSAVIKAPLSIYTRLLDAALGGSVLSLKAFRRSAMLSIFLLLACLAVSGLLTHTFFGISKTPWSAYESALVELEQIIESGRDGKTATITEEKRLEDQKYRAYMKERIERARNPYWKWGYILFFVIVVILLTIFVTTASVAFARKVAKELEATESLILISGALLLGLFVSIILVNLTVVILFTIASPLVAFSRALGVLLFGYSALLGVGIVSGYTLLAWLTSPTWIKAVAVGAIVPSLMLTMVAIICGALYPFRTLVGSSINNLLLRAVRSERGVLVFIATGATLLSAAIVMATNLVASGKP